MRPLTMSCAGGSNWCGILEGQWVEMQEGEILVQEMPFWLRVHDSD